MNTTELPQYRQVVDALAPVLYDLPGKIVAIDGRPHSGKTTLGRYLAWRFNVSLIETDLFLFEDRGALIYRLDDIDRIIEARLRKPRPVVVDSAVALRLMAELERKPDFTVYVSSTDPVETLALRDEVAAYEAKYSPKSKADLTVELRF